MLERQNLLIQGQKLKKAYDGAFHAIMAQYGLTRNEIDVLLFLANNPGCETAGAICRMRGLKPAIVSFHIDRLVGEGFLQRQPVPGDRRKTALVLTEKAAPVIEQGRRLQKSFADRLTEGLRAEDLAHFRRCVAAFERNIERIRMENPKGTEM